MTSSLPPSVPILTRVIFLNTNWISHYLRSSVALMPHQSRTHWAMTSTVWFLPKAAEALTKSCPEILLSPPQPQLTTHVQGHLPASAQGGQEVQEEGGRSWGPPRAGREPGGTWGYKFKDTTNKTFKEAMPCPEPQVQGLPIWPPGPWGEHTYFCNN